MNPPKRALRVICAEDNLDILQLLGRNLEDAAFEVQLTADGDAALAAISKNAAAFDLLITDTNMPRLDGAGLIKQARAAGYRGKVIVFAAVLSPFDRERYDALRVDRVVLKPGIASELMRAVHEVTESLYTYESSAA